MKFTSLEERNPQHLLAHGMPKSGKSTLLSQLAEAGFHLYWISLDNGHSVLHKLSPQAQANIDIIVLPDTRDFPVAAVTCMQLFKRKAAKICDAHGQIDCSNCRRNPAATWTEWDFSKLGPRDIVVVDHISGLAESIINNTCQKDFAKNEEYKFTWDDYRVQGSLMHNFLSYVQSAPFHVACIAHSLDVKAEDGNTILVPQVGTRQFSDTVGKYFDHIVYVHIHNNAHKSGSGTLYRAGVLTGSRADVALEKMKPGEVSLAAFFETKTKGAYVAQVEETAQVLKVAAAEQEAKAPAEVATSEEDTSISNIAPAQDTPASVSEVAAVPEPANTTKESEPDPSKLSIQERMKLKLASMNKGKL